MTNVKIKMTKKTRQVKQAQFQYLSF